MIRRFAAPAAPVVLCSALIGCNRVLIDGADSGNRQALRERSGGVHWALEIEGGSVFSDTGCELDYRLYLPPRKAADGIVILAHGFMRAKEHMDGLARALAEAGIATATVDFCNARLWNGRHAQNGRDMVALARSLGKRPVVYAGFSAGALAALFAAREDASARGVLALDLVDEGRQGLRTARLLDKPLLGLRGEPSACNAQGNGTSIFSEGRLGEAELVEGAGHCDFESPTSWFCELVCGRTAESTSLRREIIARAVSAVTELLGTRPGEI